MFGEGLPRVLARQEGSGMEQGFNAPGSVDVFNARRVELYTFGTVLVASNMFRQCLATQKERRGDLKGMMCCFLDFHGV